MSPAPRRARRAVERRLSAGRLLAALCCLPVVLAACSVGPSQRPPVAVRGEQLPSPPVTATAAPPADTLPEPGPMRPTITFTDCTGDTMAALGNPAPAGGPLRVRCGQLDVLTDPDQPALGHTALGVVVAGAADAPADRPPLLVVGDSDTDPSARHAAALATQVPAALLARYQLVGLDRRGTGSDMLDCAAPDERTALVDAAPATPTDADLTAQLENARAVTQNCYLLLSNAISSYGTGATAADVETLRARLGVDRLAGIGSGDGARALMIWADTHPAAVGRLVLDGPTDPSGAEPDSTEGRAAAAEQTFDAFATACGATGACPLGADPRGAVTALVDRLRTQPVVAADGRRLTAGVAVSALLTGLGEPRNWPQLATALAQAGQGTPEPMLAQLDPVLGPDGRFDSALATACNDTSRRLTPPEVGALADRWRTAYPLFGTTLAWRLLACAPWPAGSGAPVPGPADGAPPILVIGTAHDPRAPIAGSQRAAAGLTAARFVSWQGSGTGAYPRTACVTTVVDRMLLDATMPRGDSLCPP